MSNQGKVAALKEQFEELFPGKWILDVHEQKSARAKNILLGISDLDSGITRGLLRRRITEWAGPPSSGKMTMLRAAVAKWRLEGLHVAYLDPANKLLASDWSFVELANQGVQISNVVQDQSGTDNKLGRFWVIRNIQDRNGQDILWAAEQLIRSSLFDVVVFDVTSQASRLSSRIYARLQRSLDRSKTALLIVKDQSLYVREKIDNSWGCDLRVDFRWSEHVRSEDGLTGSTLILPGIRSSICKDGLCKNVEAKVETHVPNRLFAHPLVPDRRARKI